MEQELIKQNDKLLSLISLYEYKGQKELHHLIHRANLIYRYDFNNLIPVDRITHDRIHFQNGGNIDFLASLPLEKQLWIQQHKNDSFKSYLFNNRLTAVEFLQQKQKELMARVPDIYEQYLLNRQLNGLATFSTKLREQRELDRLKSFQEEKRVKLREIKPKRKKLQLAKELRHKAYEISKTYKLNLLLQTN